MSKFRFGVFSANESSRSIGRPAHLHRPCLSQERPILLTDESTSAPEEEVAPLIPSLEQFVQIIEHFRVFKPFLVKELTNMRLVLQVQNTRPKKSLS